jgi:hypothetical protein
MSKGPGLIERVLDQLFDAAPDAELTTGALCQAIYPTATTVTKAQRVAVLRAARNRPDLFWYRRLEHGDLVFTRNSSNMVLDTVDRILVHELTLKEARRRQELLMRQREE